MQVQNFNQALQNTIRYLPFSERALTQSLFTSQQYDARTLRAWVRAPTFGLGEALALARNVPNKAFKARFIEIYCDTLTVDQPVSPEPNDKDGASYSIQIYARRIIAPDPTAQTASLVVNILPGCDFALLTPNVPSKFEVAFVVKNVAKLRLRPIVDPGQFGVLFECDSTGSIKAEQMPPPDTPFVSIDYLSLIQPDGSVQDKGFANDDLPRLLQMQLLVAQANSTLDRSFALDVLNYVVVASATPWNVYLNYQACSFRNALSIDSDVTAVPSVNIYYSKHILKARLQAALAFEASFKDFSSQSATAGYQVMTALNLLAKSNDALETYAFLYDIKQRDYDRAVESSAKAASVFRTNQDDIKARTTEFQKGVDKFKSDEERKAVFACILGVVEVIGAIAATVATGGAAAPTIAAAGASTAQAVGKVATLVQKLKDIFTKLKDIYEKIKPVLEKLKSLVDTAKTVIENLRKVIELTDAAKALTPDVKSNDVINATAEWKRFNLEVTSMEDSIRDYDIDGKQKFFMALKTLVINGEAFIQAQANLVLKGDELATVMLQKKMEGRDQKRLSTMVFNIAANDKVLGLLRRAMFDRLLAIRGLVYLDFSTYVSAYNYHTLRRENVIVLSPVKPVADFLDDAAKLQGAVASFGSRVLVQSRTFVFKTLCGFSSAGDLMAQLIQGKPVRAGITANDLTWQGFSRIRLSAARCFLEGVKIATSTSVDSTKQASSIRIQLTTDGRFADLQDPRTGYIGLQTSATPTVPAQLVRNFIGDTRRLLCEYHLSDGTVICDGAYGQVLDYTKQTPITSWEITLMNQSDEISGSALLSSRLIDFTNFTGIRLEFTCDVVWSGF